MCSSASVGDCCDSSFSIFTWSCWIWSSRSSFCCFSSSWSCWQYSEDSFSFSCSVSKEIWRAFSSSVNCSFSETRLSFSSDFDWIFTIFSSIFSLKSFSWWFNDSFKEFTDEICIVSSSVSEADRCRKVSSFSLFSSSWWILSWSSFRLDFNSSFSSANPLIRFSWWSADEFRGDRVSTLSFASKICELEFKFFSCSKAPSFSPWFSSLMHSKAVNLWVSNLNWFCR